MINRDSYQISRPGKGAPRIAFDAGRRYAMRHRITNAEGVNYYACIAELTRPEVLVLNRLKTEDFGNFYRAGFFAQVDLNRKAEG